MEVDKDGTEYYLERCTSDERKAIKAEKVQNEKIALEIMEIFKSNKVSYRQSTIIMETVNKYVRDSAIIQ